MSAIPELLAACTPAHQAMAAQAGDRWPATMSLRYSMQVQHWLPSSPDTP